MLQIAPNTPRNSVDDGNEMRQPDRSRREAASDIHEEAEMTGRSRIGDTWNDEADMDEELQLNIKRRTGHRWRRKTARLTIQ